jgi:hypothetical protein
MLGHANSNVTRAVYLQEVRTVERSAKRRGRLEARMGSTLEALGGSPGGSNGIDEDRSLPTTPGGEVVELRPKAAATS